ncbi:MAG: hypothetical protein ACRD0Q_11530 [Acidimicrobiales bacterium]
MRGRVLTISAIALALATGGFTLRYRDGDQSVAVGPAPTVVDMVTITTAAPTTTEPPTTSPSTVPPTTKARVTTTRATRPTVTAPKAQPAAAVKPVSPSPSESASGLPASFAGLGTWVDVFDFNPAHTNGQPPAVSPATVDTMADAGVRTLYLQSARPNDPLAPGDLVSPDLLAQFLTRAHARGMRVVAWYLPHFADVSDDMRHLSAMLAFKANGRGFDGIGLDIEWRAAVPDAAARGAQLVELSRQLNAAAGALPVGAIVLPPVVTDVINPAYWPGFPWESIKPYYDAWLPMGYWTNRRAGTPDRDAYHHTTDNIRLLRQHLGDVPIHFVGGIGNAATAADYAGFVQALAENGIAGRSIYDWATTGAGPMAALKG